MSGSLEAEVEDRRQVCCSKDTKIAAVVAVKSIKPIQRTLNVKFMGLQLAYDIDARKYGMT